MAGRKKNIVQKIAPKRQITRQRRRRRNGGNSTGRLVARGVKSLISKIPSVGPVLAGLADYIFAAFGLTTFEAISGLVEGGSAREVTTRAVSLIARFNIDSSIILAGSRSSIAVDMGKKILSQYSDGRILSITIRVVPSGPVAKRSGDWHLGFQPFFNDDDEKRAGINDKDWMPTEQGIHRLYLSTTGPATKPLVLTFRPKITDGRAYQFNPLNSAYGQVCIRYDNYDRSGYGEFTPDDFNCDTIISGVIETRLSSAMPPTAAGGYTYTNFVSDKNSEKVAYLYAPGKRMMAIRNDDCTNKNTYCLMSGTVNKIWNMTSYSESDPPKTEEDAMLEDSFCHLQCAN